MREEIRLNLNEAKNMVLLLKNQLNTEENTKLFNKLTTFISIYDVQWLKNNLTQSSTH